MNQQEKLKTSSKCLDHILTTIPECHDLCGVAKISVSDHYLIYTSVECKRNNASHNLVRFRDYTNFDSKNFIEDLNKCEMLCNKDDTSDSMEVKWKQVEICVLRYL